MQRNDYLKLRKCPFCGSDAELVDYGLNGNFKVVQCSVCGARTRMFDTDIKRGENAVEAWNRRASDERIR